MSDLTRYTYCRDRNGHPSFQEKPGGVWVSAEEAEARIKELEAERNKYLRSALELRSQLDGAQAEIRAMSIQIRAADELADAVLNFRWSAREEVGRVSPAEEAMYPALTAYREAGK